MGFQTCETIDGGKDNWVAVLSWRAAASAGVLMLKITMRLLRSAWLAICCVSCWSAMAETQHIEIYRYTGHSWPPQIEDATLLWRDGCAALIETMCTDSVKALVADIAEANTTLGEPVGFNGDTIRFILHSAAGQERSSYAPDSNSIYMHSSVAAGWNRDFPRKSAVFHEMGHAFFDKHVGRRFCTSCSRGNIEHWGVDEGFAFIVAKLGGGSEASPSPAPSQGDCSEFIQKSRGGPTIMKLIAVLVGIGWAFCERRREGLVLANRIESARGPLQGDLSNIWRGRNRQQLQR